MNHLPEKYLPAPIKPTNTFRRAVRAASAQLDGGLMLRAITEPHCIESEAIVVGLVRNLCPTARSPGPHFVVG